MLIYPIIVTGDRPRTNIDPRSHISITNITQMIHLRAHANIRVLNLDKVANFRFLS